MTENEIRIGFWSPSAYHATLLYNTLYKYEHINPTPVFTVLAETHHVSNRSALNQLGLSARVMKGVNDMIRSSFGYSHNSMDFSKVGSLRSVLWGVNLISEFSPQHVGENNVSGEFSTFNNFLRHTQSELDNIYITSSLYDEHFPTSSSLPLLGRPSQLTSLLNQAQVLMDVHESLTIKNEFAALPIMFESLDYPDQRYDVNSSKNIALCLQSTQTLAYRSNYAAQLQSVLKSYLVETQAIHEYEEGDPLNTFYTLTNVDTSHISYKKSTRSTNSHQKSHHLTEPDLPRLLQSHANRKALVPFAISHTFQFAGVDRTSVIFNPSAEDDAFYQLYASILVRFVLQFNEKYKTNHTISPSQHIPQLIRDNLENNDESLCNARYQHINHSINKCFADIKTKLENILQIQFNYALLFSQHHSVMLMLDMIHPIGFETAMKLLDFIDEYFSLFLLAPKMDTRDTRSALRCKLDHINKYIVTHDEIHGDSIVQSVPFFDYDKIVSNVFQTIRREYPDLLHSLDTTGISVTTSVPKPNFSTEPVSKELTERRLIEQQKQFHFDIDDIINQIIISQNLTRDIKNVSALQKTELSRSQQNEITSARTSVRQMPTGNLNYKKRSPVTNDDLIPSHHLNVTDANIDGHQNENRIENVNHHSDEPIENHVHINLDHDVDVDIDDVDVDIDDDNDISVPGFDDALENVSHDPSNTSNRIHSSIEKTSRSSPKLHPNRLFSDLLAYPPTPFVYNNRQIAVCYIGSDLIDDDNLMSRRIVVEHRISQLEAKFDNILQFTRYNIPTHNRPVAFHQVLTEVCNTIAMNTCVTSLLTKKATGYVPLASMKKSSCDLM